MRFRVETFHGTCSPWPNFKTLSGVGVLKTVGVHAFRRAADHGAGIGAFEGDQLVERKGPDRMERRGEGSSHGETEAALTEWRIGMDHVERLSGFIFSNLHWLLALRSAYPKSHGGTAR